MRLSINWLKEYVNLDGVTPEQLADKLTVAGLEVEGIEKVAEGTNLVIGEVLTCKAHPDSDHLHVTTVNVGDEVLNIVCGAPNVAAGQKVIVSKVGAKLAGGFEIKPAKVRGVESNGMICSLSELGVDKKWQTEEQLSGIYVFENDAPVGETKVLEYLGLDDTILDVGLTPNRADCNAMWNIAREVAAVLHREVKLPECAGASNCGTPTNFKLASTTEKCPVFVGKVVNHVKVGPSPKWMQNYLHSYGVKSINNVVDISNYVMIETGQPLHYYDLSKLPHHEITVVDDVDMTMQALDGIDYEIKKGDLLITTGGVPTGIAGIMGGEESKIDENTTSIFIEAAAFNAVSIRNTSRRLGLATEAASHFIKGLEPLSQIKAVDRSVQLLTELADASEFEENVMVGTIDYEQKTVTETLTHCNTLLGTDFKMEDVLKVLSELNLNPVQDGDSFTCTIPSYRTDLNIREDIDEEIIRLLGYDGLKKTLPTMEATVGELTPVQKARRTVRNTLTGLGLSETVTYTLVSERAVDEGSLMSFGDAVELASPMSEERRYVRTAILPKMIECLAYNTAHKNENVNLFEISAVYAVGDAQERIGIAMSGNLQASKLHKMTVVSDFYSLKGVLETLLKQLGVTSNRLAYKENTEDCLNFHPYRSACVYLGKELLGVMGELHPQLIKEMGLPKGAVYAEIRLDLLMEVKLSKVKFKPIAKYPSVKRDIALVVKSDVQAASLSAVISKAGKALVKNIEVFDVYEGEHVEAGYKSVALSILYQADDHTLTDAEITAVHTSILTALEKQCGAVLRG
ncbi:MAG: phenylalanine--tRNA ligase subunit beta [Erysipelotrichaceae bacterium]|nr:phenylalanine--tRNA ligase subunit beta [Erysipelotrichaceae bacterium]